MVSTELIEETVDRLVAEHGPRAMGLIRRILADRDEAEDAYQETWYTVWRTWGNVRRRRDPWPYIRRTAVSRALDQLRSRRRRDHVRTGVEAEPIEEVRVAPPTIRLDGLVREERAALVLFFWEGLSVKEISAELEVPVGTVKTWMFRARGKLRRRLDAETGEALDGDTLDGAIREPAARRSDKRREQDRRREDR